MARSTTIKLECDRCKRTEYLGVEAHHGPALAMTFMGTVVRYEDLCSSCLKSVGNYIKQITRETNKDAKGEELEAPPPEISIEPEL